MQNQNNVNNKKILVVGDCMLDEYVWGNVNRVSPESCCPILNTTHMSYRCGGAANVAYQLHYIGNNVILYGIAGKDQTGKILNELLSGKVDNKLFTHNTQTTKKTRFVNNASQQMFRVDEESFDTLSEDDLETILQSIHKEKKSLECIVLSDYNKGVLTEHSTQKIIAIAQCYSIPIVVDLKDANVAKYTGATIIKGNLSELRRFFPNEDVNLHNVAYYAMNLKQLLQSRYVAITLGQDGIVAVDDKNSKIRVSANHIPVYDVTGAGDVVTAFIAANINKCSCFADVITIANKAANIKVGKLGNVPVSMEELLLPSKTKTIEELLPLITNKKIVFTNGCFDILHAGHVDLLKKAKMMGDILIVGLNSDKSIRKIKGENRPINTQNARLEVISAVQYVDYIVLFDEDTPLSLIEKIKPSILVKGGDYEANAIVGSNFVKSIGGEVKTIPFTYDTSTTKIIDRI